MAAPPRNSRAANNELTIPAVDRPFYRAATVFGLQQQIDAFNAQLPPASPLLLNYRGRDKAGLYNLLLSASQVMYTKPGHPANPILLPALLPPPPAPLPFPAPDYPRVFPEQQEQQQQRLLFKDVLDPGIYQNLTTAQLWALLQTDPDRFLTAPRQAFDVENNLLQFDRSARMYQQPGTICSLGTEPHLLEYIIARAGGPAVTAYSNWVMQQIVLRFTVYNTPYAFETAPPPAPIPLLHHAPRDRYLALLTRTGLDDPEQQRHDTRPPLHRVAGRVRWDPSYAVRMIRFLATIGFDPNELYAGRRPLDVALAAAASTVGNSALDAGGMLREAMRGVCALISVGARPSLVDGATAECAGWMLRSLGWGVVDAARGETWPVIRPGVGVANMTLAECLGRDGLADREQLGEGMVLMALVLMFSRTNRWHGF